MASGGRSTELPGVFKSAPTEVGGVEVSLDADGMLTWTNVLNFTPDSGTYMVMMDAERLPEPRLVAEYGRRWR